MKFLSYLPWTRSNRAKKLALESDFGRTYGWFITREGLKIGELDYIRWDSDGQFWHEYLVAWENGKELKPDPDQWLKEKITLQNRKYPDVKTSNFLIAHKPDKIISVRNAFVPVERFEQDEEV